MKFENPQRCKFFIFSADHFAGSNSSIEQPEVGEIKSVTLKKTRLSFKIATGSWRVSIRIRCAKAGDVFVIPSESLEMINYRYSPDNALRQVAKDIFRVCREEFLPLFFDDLSSAASFGLFALSLSEFFFVLSLNSHECL